MQHPFYLTALALTFIFSFVLGIFTILLNPRSKVHLLWFLTTMGVSLWSGAMFSFIWATPNEKLGWIFAKGTNIGSTLLLIFFFHFILEFLLKIKQYKPLLFFGYFIAGIFIILILQSRLFIKAMIPKAGFDMWIEPGIYYWFYGLYIFCYVVLCINFLYQGFIGNDGIKRKQLLYILLAAVIGFTGGMTNLLPGYFNIYPFGIFIVFLYPILITYGMFLPQVKIKF